MCAWPCEATARASSGWRALFPGARDIYENAILPDFRARHGRDPRTPQEVKRAMDDNFFYRGSNVVGRAAQELVWDVVGESVERPLDGLDALAKPKSTDLGTLRTDPSLKMPR